MDTLSPWFFNSYGRVYRKAVHNYQIKCAAYTPLPRSVAEDFNNGVLQSPPTEEAAMILWLDGYIKGAVYTDSHHYVQRKYRRAAVLPADHDCTEHRRHHRAIGRICCECGERKPLTPHYWHHSKTNAGGFHSMCKTCRNHVERQRIAEKRRVA